MRNPRIQPVYQTRDQAMTRRALQAHFRREMMVFGLFLLVLAAFAAFFFLPGAH